jgi:hypothetical protein
MRISRTSARTRSGAALTLAGLVAGLLISTPSAQAAPASPEAGAASDWLVAQLDDDHLLRSTYDWGSATLYGPTLDGVLGMRAVGAQPEVRAAMLDAVGDQAGAYVGTGEESYAGALGKLATVALAEGRDLGTFAGGDLLSRLQDRIVTAANRQRGRAKDKSVYGDYSNTYSQAWTVRALNRSRARYRGIATTFLLKQQCAAGWFRQGMDSSDFTCDTGRGEGTSSPDVDATALAVMALREARAAGITGLGDDIGAFVGNGVQNANSTGLAAWVLRLAGRDGAAARATTWLQRRQVVESEVVGTALAGEGGAVAYNQPAYTKALDDGITQGDVRSQWLVAVTQAVPGLVPPQ